MTPHRQPTNSSCGQTAVAMLLDKTPREVGKVVGHMTTTYIKDFVKAFNHFGAVCDDNWRLAGEDSKLPDIGIVRFAALRRDRRNPSGYAKTGSVTRHGHAVVKFGDKFYDPATGLEFDGNQPGWKVWGYIEVLLP